MKARLLCALTLLLVCAASGCRTMNLCKGRGCNGCGRQASHESVGCVGCVAAAGTGVAGTGLAPTGVGPTGLAPTGIGPTGVAGTGIGGSGIPDGRYSDYGQPAFDGPRGPQVGYPYYTTRGPRDFFTNNPPSIGN